MSPCTVMTDTSMWLECGTQELQTEFWWRKPWRQLLQRLKTGSKIDLQEIGWMELA